MGRIYDKFGKLKYRNEAEVSQNFLVPLLTEFLGYSREEILPEHLVPAFDIPQNRDLSISTTMLSPKAKPDYIVTVDGKFVFICDSKGPNENLDEYLDQLIAYCLGLRSNLLLITNGTELRVYDANNPLFQAQDVETLDLNYLELYKLLHKANVAKYTDIQRVQMLDLPRSLQKDAESLQAERQRSVALSLSDLEEYLNRILQSTPLELPFTIRSAFEIQSHWVPADELYSFNEYEERSRGPSGNRAISFRNLLREVPNPVPFVIVGESGSGKSSLLRQLLIHQAGLCVGNDSDVVPVLVKLGQCVSGRTIIDQVIESFKGKGAAISADGVTNLLRDGRLLILMDAFDEIFEPIVSSAEREIQALIENYGKCKIIITTRYFRLPHIYPVKHYDLQRLSYQKIQTFSQSYLGNESLVFLNSITRRGLSGSASNTLLLTLLVLLYRQYKKVPVSRGQILQSIVDRVREWDSTKGERFSSALTWEARFELLAELAMACLSTGQNYSLDKASTEAVLRDSLNRLEQDRQIPRGLSLDQTISSLAATGFIDKSDEGITFWHRAFVEHFAAIELARQLEMEEQLLENSINKPEWEEILPLAVLHATHPSLLAQRIIAHNIFIAGRVLVECPQLDEAVKQQIIDALCRKSESRTLSIRRLATDLLRQIEGEYINAQFYNLLKSEFVDVKKAALVEIASRRLPDAREIVYSHVDWEVEAPTWAEGGSGNAVIAALAEFDDSESHRQIIAKWRQKPDVFTDESCHKAFMNVIRRGAVSEVIRRELLDFFFAGADEVFHGLKLHNLGDALIALNDRSMVPRLIAALDHEEKDISRPYRIVEILSSYTDDETIGLLIACVNEQKRGDYARQRLAQALCNSKGKVPLEVFEALAHDPDMIVRSHALRGLGRFAFNQVSKLILPSIHPPSHSEWHDQGNYFHVVQAAVFEVLAQHGQIELLLKEEIRPAILYQNSLEVVYESIAKDHLVSMIPFLEQLLVRLRDDREKVKVAWLLADLGRQKQAQDIVELLRPKGRISEWVTYEIVEGVHRLPSDYALSVIDDILNIAEKEAGDRSGHINSKCIEALQRIGTPDACERLTQIVEKKVTGDPGLELELALRMIEFLAPKDKEKWLIDLIEKNPQMEKDNSALRRALEILSVIGGENSLPLLQERFIKSFSPDWVSAELQVTCFWAIQNIHKRLGKLWFNEEEKDI